MRCLVLYALNIRVPLSRRFIASRPPSSLGNLEKPTAEESRRRHGDSHHLVRTIIRSPSLRWAFLGSRRSWTRRTVKSPETSRKPSPTNRIAFTGIPPSCRRYHTEPFPSPDFLRNSPFLDTEDCDISGNLKKTTAEEWRRSHGGSHHITSTIRRIPSFRWTFLGARRPWTWRTVKSPESSASELRRITPYHWHYPAEHFFSLDFLRTSPFLDAVKSPETTRKPPQRDRIAVKVDPTISSAISKGALPFRTSLGARLSWIRRIVNSPETSGNRRQGIVVADPTISPAISDGAIPPPDFLKSSPFLDAADPEIAANVKKPARQGIASPSPRIPPFHRCYHLEPIRTGS
ncbi:hypothetical protein BHM03_00045211 [Ensete ventricosum]|nr:hypothetical protein BHM03_00045211 [Ensete ventricosum]